MTVTTNFVRQEREAAWLAYQASEMERVRHNNQVGSQNWVTHMKWHYPPKLELMDRLNRRLKGLDNERPQNWRGL